MQVKAEVMDAEDMRRALFRVSHEIIEQNKGAEQLALVGIRTRGVPLAQRLAGLIQEHEGAKIPVGTLDITFYRDDLSLLSPQPVVHQTEIPFQIGRAHV